MIVINTLEKVPKSSEVPSVPQMQDALQRFTDLNPEDRTKILKDLDIDEESVIKAKNTLDTKTDTIYGKVKTVFVKIKDFVGNSLKFLWRHKWKILIGAVIAIGIFFYWYLGTNVKYGLSALPEQGAKDIVNFGKDALNVNPISDVTSGIY